MTILVPSEAAGSRVDAFLSETSGDLSRSRIQQLIKDGLVLVNGAEVKANRRLAAGDEISLEVPEPEPVQITPEEIPLDIVYEDDDVLLVNKPKGMVVHPAHGHLTGTLVHAVMHHCGDSLSGINGELRPGIVHRIDRDTSGLLIICKNDRAHLSLSEQLKEHSITRVYEAVVCGVVKEDEFTVNAPIGRDRKDRKKMAVDPDGRRAVTHVEVIKRFKKYTYVRCRLETGRTHQIRVHLASRHFPILGDAVYGPRKAVTAFGGQVLHARTFGFIHPSTGEYMEFSAPLPESFLEALAWAEKQN
ncbi:MAG: RluA family pseudouridine synthase [Lachnospiraceae bacterium]|nr:RluA family pseudouridine synthase [Lachnospiraceae bacterium]